ncbi:MAG: DNA mismatch repair endonuclease MutL [Cyclobacteriaceae bacterium]|nr:DNA mismatch repair endonuclease MutL [Cyclobacteriaceae bacterium HetDA_MAG_MS6]
MGDIIQLLPDSIANQIAAGEVVQRPASVVKELLENSIDAGAKHIKLIIKDAGKSQIQVIDDGKGMSVTDARMSFERHATSKLRISEDLFKIRTMGFRGEALASIAAVAQVELKTRTEDEELGTVIQVESSEVKKQEPESTAKGTSICVKNLFYNVPARRNFLKSNPVELKHITEEFQRIALANPAVAFSFYQNDLETSKVSSGKLSQRIVQLFGKNYQNQLVSTLEETPYVRVTGYIGKPEFARKTRGEQFFFVNNRFIKNAYLNHAVTQAYEGLLGENFYPFYVLFISLDPKHVDINVHPTKTEVKFDDDRLLYGVIASAVRQSLASFNVTPSLDFETDVNFELISKTRGEHTTKQESQYGQWKTLGVEKRNLEHWEKLYTQANREEEKQIEEAKRELDEGNVLKFESKANENRQSSGLKENKQAIQIHGRYLIRQVTSGMVMIDQRAAHERILYERYIERYQSEEGFSQSCMFPQRIELNPADMALVLDIKPEIRQLGFEFEVLGKNSLAINGVPAEIKANEKELFEGLIEQFKSNKNALELNSQENLAQSLAKRMAIRIGQYLQPEEAEGLFDQLFACSQPNYTPDGSPTFVVLSLEKIAALFK